MTVLRFLSGLFLLLALVALVADLTAPIMGIGPFAPTSLGALWADVAPRTLEAAKAAASRGMAMTFWNVVVVQILKVPTFVLLGLAGILLGWLGRRRQQINVFVN